MNYTNKLWGPDYKYLDETLSILPDNMINSPFTVKEHNYLSNWYGEYAYPEGDVINRDRYKNIKCLFKKLNINNSFEDLSNDNNHNEFITVSNKKKKKKKVIKYKTFNKQVTLVEKKIRFRNKANNVKLIKPGGKKFKNKKKKEWYLRPCK